MRKLLLGTAVVMAGSAIATALALVAAYAMLGALIPDLQRGTQYEE